MKSLENSNTSNQQEKKMTLMDYYESLSPARVTERALFIEKVCEDLEVSPPTVLNWIAGRNLPQKESYYVKLSELTGIPKDELFVNRSAIGHTTN